MAQPNDVEDEIGIDSTEDSDFESDGDSDVIEDVDYPMMDDDAMFDLNVDHDVELDGSYANNSYHFSKNVYEQLEELDGDVDCMISDDEGLNSDKGSSDGEKDASGLNIFPRFNPRTESRRPVFVIGQLFSTREELKGAIDTYSIKNARDVLYKRNSTARIRAVCKDKNCKWYIYAARLSGETGLQVRGFSLEHTCLPVYNNKTLSSTWLSKNYNKRFRNYPNLRAADFRREMGEKLGQNVTKWMAWSARTSALTKFCVRHLHENFKRAGFRGDDFKVALWTAATATTTQYFKTAMAKLKTMDQDAYNWLVEKEPSQWSKAYFKVSSKCDVLLNNMCEVFNSLILDARDKPVITLMSMVKDLIMIRMQVNRDRAENWEGKLCPKPRAKLLQYVKEASECRPLKSDQEHFQVQIGTQKNQCAVDLGKRTCSCRRWQLSGIPCKHACACIRLNGKDVEDYVDDCYTVKTYKKVYAPFIQPLSGPELWPQTGRTGPLPPPKQKKKAGRPKRLRRVNPFEVDDKGKSATCKIRKYLCKKCKGPGHNSKTCKLIVEPEIPRSKSNLAVPLVPNHICGVAIRAPPPMIGSMQPNSVPFRPPGRLLPRPLHTFLTGGQKFANIRDFQQL